MKKEENWELWEDGGVVEFGSVICVVLVETALTCVDNRREESYCTCADPQPEWPTNLGARLLPPG